MTISLRLSEKESTLFKNYADMNGITVSELVRRAVLNQIEDELDLEAFNKAYAAYLADPVTYTLDEVESELGLQ